MLISDAWGEMFNQAVACSVTVPTSDHLPIHMQMLPNFFPKSKSRFRFENLWLRESICRDIMVERWGNTQGMSLFDRIGTCSKAIWNWGRKFATDFERQILFGRNKWNERSTDVILTAYPYLKKRNTNILVFFTTRMTTGVRELNNSG